jgi:hypothetical protein
MVGIAPRIGNIGIRWRLSASILPTLCPPVATDTQKILGRLGPTAAPVILEKRKNSLATTGNRTKIRGLP